jgi:hypothetical protein
MPQNASIGKSKNVCPDAMAFPLRKVPLSCFEVCGSKTCSSMGSTTLMSHRHSERSICQKLVKNTWIQAKFCTFSMNTTQHCLKRWCKDANSIRGAQRKFQCFILTKMSYLCFLRSECRENVLLEEVRSDDKEMMGVGIASQDRVDVQRNNEQQSAFDLYYGKHCAYHGRQYTWRCCNA